jgi:hypothetical protein
MSRVDEEREAARAAERQMQAKRAEESRKKDAALQDSQFAKLVAQSKGEQALKERDQGAKSAIAHLLESSKEERHDEAALLDKLSTRERDEQKSFKGRLGSKAMSDRAQANTRADGQRAESSKLQTDQGRADSARGRSNDQAASSKSAQGRQADAKSSREVAVERAESSDRAKEEHASLEGGEHAEGKVDADGSGKGGGGQQSGGGEKKGDLPAGFKFNPALMAPPPVAKPNQTTSSDRLRRIATEIAQKIVERVRVGTNAAGATEFQIDLRNDVLSGLQVKVSAKNGRISAVFSGSDRDVLKMLQEHEEALKGALLTRGLTLFDFKVEAK